LDTIAKSPHTGGERGIVPDWRAIGITRRLEVHDLHRGWAYFQARLAFTMAAFNVLVQWHGFRPNVSGFVPLSMAEFSL
jgi:hypothetical protein